MFISSYAKDEVGKRIKVQRRLRDMTRAELGAQIGCSGMDILKAECGAMQISDAKLSALCKALGCSIEDILNGR